MQKATLTFWVQLLYKLCCFLGRMQLSPSRTVALMNPRQAVKTKV
jgi:hypothetical protein